MHCIQADPPIAISNSYCDRAFTPIRRANYNDKSRIRLAAAKHTALIECGWGTTANVKKYLAVLGLNLDLRYTSSWVALYLDLKPQMTAAKAIVEALEEPPVKSKFKVGDPVIWNNAPVYLEAWGALKIEAIASDMAQLELWNRPVPLEELEAA